MSILTSVVKGVAITAGTLLVAGTVVGYFGIRELKKRQAASLTAYHNSIKADLVELNESFEAAKAAGDQVEMVRIKGEIDVIELAIEIGNSAATQAVGCPPLETLKSELANMRTNRLAAIREGDVRLVESIELHISMHELLIKGHPEANVA